MKNFDILLALAFASVIIFAFQPFFKASKKRRVINNVTFEVNNYDYNNVSMQLCKVETKSNSKHIA